MGYTNEYEYVDQAQEHYDYQYMTDQELDEAEAIDRGRNNPDKAWVSTSRDVWHANPFYTGSPVPHPEDC